MELYLYFPMPLPGMVPSKAQGQLYLCVIRACFYDRSSLSTVHGVVASVDGFGENLKEINHLEDLGIGSRILLKYLK
jgi:hypothetical protein